MASRADDYERNKSHSVFRLFQVHMSCSRYGIAKERSGISMTDPRATCRCGYPDTYNPCDKHRGKPSDPAAKALLNKIGESKIDLNDPRLAKQMTDEEIRNSD